MYRRSEAAPVGGGGGGGIKDFLRNLNFDAKNYLKWDNCINRFAWLITLLIASC